MLFVCLFNWPVRLFVCFFVCLFVCLFFAPFFFSSSGRRWSWRYIKASHRRSGTARTGFCGQPNRAGPQQDNKPISFTRHFSGGHAWFWQVVYPSQSPESLKEYWRKAFTQLLSSKPLAIIWSYICVHLCFIHSDLEPQNVRKYFK